VAIGLGTVVGGDGRVSGVIELFPVTIAWARGGAGDAGWRQAGIDHDSVPRGFPSPS
jgi:hypothetical protein